MFPNFTALHMVAQVILCTLLSQEQNYRIEVTADADKNNAIRIDWQRESQRAQKDQHCGVYCLRTNIPDWSEEQLWTTYTLLTKIEATFRSLKTGLGLRPVYHQKKEERVTGHLFITLLSLIWCIPCAVNSSSRASG